MPAMAKRRPVCTPLRALIWRRPMVLRATPTTAGAPQAIRPSGYTKPASASPFVDGADAAGAYGRGAG
jgi:hypothetical protein